METIQAEHGGERLPASGRESGVDRAVDAARAQYPEQMLGGGGCVRDQCTDQTR